MSIRINFSLRIIYPNGISLLQSAVYSAKICHINIIYADFIYNETITNNLYCLNRAKWRRVVEMIPEVLSVILSEHLHSSKTFGLE